MASPYPGQINPVQVGSYFLTHYYQMLQSQPQMVYQFYSSMSTMVRFDPSTMETVTATNLMQINNLLMCLNLNEIEIKAANFLDSWNGGILVLVTGLVHLKDCSARRSFTQTFFLAPQEKGYFVLNDMFYFLEDAHDHHPPLETDFAPREYETKMNSSVTMTEPVSNFVQVEEVQPQEVVARGHEDGSGVHDEYRGQQIKQQEFSESDTRFNEVAAELSVSFPSPTKTKQEPHPIAEEEFVGEQPKLTYASVLLTKGQAAHPVPQALPSSRPPVAVSELQRDTQSTQQLPQPVQVSEKPSIETFQDSGVPEDDGEFLSVYVGNLSPSTTEYDLEQQFKTFGRIRSQGVAIRSRKEAGVFYGFVEFEDITGVQNALKASPIELNGRLIHVEERRPNSGLLRGGRRGRSRGGYPPDNFRGRVSGGRSFGRGSGQDFDRDYFNRPRGNGYQRRGSRADGILQGSQ